MKEYALRKEISPEARTSLKAYPELLQHLLFYRDVKTAKDAEDFLRPDYANHIHDPYLMKDMEKAVIRILKAVEKNEKVMIYTDYDADGIPAGVIFHDFFKKIGFTNFENYFPHRYEEGYGLNIAAIEKFAKSGVSLIVTADCGIADVDQVKRANELGINVIVTDHHVAQEVLPPAYAILDPKQPGCTYPYNMLCGSGVVFKLIQAILQKNSFGMDDRGKERLEKWLLDMVGLATMADMVPLKGENRVLAYYGLMVLRKSPRLGLIKLLRKIKVSQQHLSEDDIGFMLVPRINAASRMGLPIEAFYLLTASDDIEADRTSTYLDKINNERKGIAASTVKEVKKHISERMQSVNAESTDAKVAGAKKILVIGNPNWRPPLLGPVANTIMETYKVPVFLWGRADGEVIKGSCRSDGSVSLVEIMKAVPSGILLAFGGHRAAGGFSISHEKIHLLEDELAKAYEQMHLGQAESRPVYVDKKINFDEVSWDTYRLIEKLSPFGEDNPKPVFLFERAVIVSTKQFGKEKNHLELQFERSDNSRVTAIGFFMTPDSFEMKPEIGKQINLVAIMEKSMFKSYPELRLRILDIMPA